MADRKAADGNDIYNGVDQTLLTSRVSDYHITEIAANLATVSWELLAPFIGLTAPEVTEIREDFLHQPDLQRRRALHIWKWKSGDNATYKTLIDILCSQGQRKLAETVVRMLISPEEFRDGGSRRLVTTFHQQLLDGYCEVVQHPLHNQWPTLDSLQQRKTFIDLKLCESPLSEVVSMKTPSVESSSQPVALGDVLADRKEEKRLIVLFEGIAGSGKTTLCQQVSREWAKKQLLQQFHLLIHLRLNDPQLQSAKTLDDFIINAMENWICKEVTSIEKRICKEVTSYIFDLKGENICFLLDGLDEAPPTLLNTVLDLINGRLGVQLPRLSFVMTTRPNSRIMKSILDLRSRIVIGGFSVAKLHEFVDLSLGSLDDNKRILREKFVSHPALEEFCTLPVNAVCMAYLVQSFNDSASYSKADIYQFILSNFLVRHLRLRTDQKTFSEIGKLTDSDSLPSQIQEPFKQMCLLAYTASEKGKALFTTTELGLPLLKVDNTLGILQIHRKVTMMGEKQYYSFPYPSLQEFLAAVHVSNKQELGK